MTGGARGIGRGIVHYLSQHGWQVIAADKDADALQGLAQDSFPTRVDTILLDVSDEKEVGRVFESIAKEQAAGRGLKLLVNNAGLADPVCGPLEELSLSDWQRWQDSHLTGAFLMTRAALPLLRRAKGSIVNMASTRAIMSEPHTESYAAAKGALVAFTHALAISYGPEVRANAVLPGWIETGSRDELGRADHEQHPAGRVGAPEDIARAVHYLATAGFVTGQTLIADGGMTRKMIYVE
ncbi:SDR family NAD(P)-dependent oxidoreductase [Pacificimonas flava]|uniref:SDR family NAD(P)-dependent oxidoreductase n=1 Tax=Pacificimonas flava TaxID=1234595 RepID=UPI00056ED32E|nr:SDR family oxidoreductase [Pacificimonas flava]